MKLLKADRKVHRHSDQEITRKSNRDDYQARIDRLKADKPEPSKALPQVSRWRR